MTQPIAYTDFYKTDHRRQYPEGTEVVYSNFTARGSRIKGIDSHVVFGIQYLIKEYLIKRFNEGFFKLGKEEAVRKYKRRLDNALGKDSVPVDHIGALHDLGYLPIKIKALREGTICPMRIPCMTITNTLPDFYWVVNFLETIISNVIWGPMTSATIANHYRNIFDEFAEKTSDIPDFVDFQGHDFSMRGMYGLEAAVMSGSAHLLSFKGTDTIPAIDFLEEYYNADSDKELIGASVPATEHSVMCCGGDDKETFKRLLTDIYPTGIVSVVSDTWDYWDVLSNTLVDLKDIIMGRDGKLVIRPDSGDPVDIICGNRLAKNGSPEYKGSVEVLWEIFGGEVNSKGYKQLDSHIGLIYGDAITIDRAERILYKLRLKGFASTNIVFGIGSYTYQYVTRDTFGFAMKSTYTEINGEPKNIFKKPKTDNGLKFSARGLLKVTETNGKSLLEEVTWEEEGQGMLETVFLEGHLIKEISLEGIRKTLIEERKAEQ